MLFESGVGPFYFWPHKSQNLIKMKTMIAKIEKGDCPNWMLCVATVLKFGLFMAFFPSLYLIGAYLTQA